MVAIVAAVTILREQPMPAMAEAAPQDAAHGEAGAALQEPVYSDA